MEARYNKTVGIIYIAISMIFVCFYFALTLNGNKGSIFLTLAFIGILFGVLILKRIYFEVHDDHLVLHAILGSAKTTYKFQSLKDFEIENNKLYLIQDGKRQKINITAKMTDKNDWQTFIEKIEQS